MSLFLFLCPISLLCASVFVPKTHYFVILVLHQILRSEIVISNNIPQEQFSYPRFSGFYMSFHLLTILRISKFSRIALTQTYSQFLVTQSVFKNEFTQTFEQKPSLHLTMTFSYFLKFLKVFTVQVSLPCLDSLPNVLALLLVKKKMRYSEYSLLVYRTATSFVQ